MRLRQIPFGRHSQAYHAAFPNFGFTINNIMKLCTFAAHFAQSVSLALALVNWALASLQRRRHTYADYLATCTHIAYMQIVRMHNAERTAHTSKTAIIES